MKSEKLPFFEFVKPSAVVIIQTSNPKEPVLIFKQLGSPFYAEAPLGNGSLAYNDFLVYWNGNFLNHTLPDCINDSQREFFQMLIKESFTTHHWWEDFPDGCIEMPLAILKKSEFQLSRVPLLKNVRNILRNLDLLSEKRGKFKTPSDFLISRDKDVIDIYIKLGQPKRMPIKRMWAMAEQKGKELFPNDKNRAYQYDLSDRQIRNIINKFLTPST